MESYIMPMTGFLRVKKNHARFTRKIFVVGLAPLRIRTVSRFGFLGWVKHKIFSVGVAFNKVKLNWQVVFATGIYLLVSHLTMLHWRHTEMRV